MVRESGNASARTRQQARAKRSQCACSAASSGSMCDARGSCVTRVVCAPSGPAPRGWPSGVDCRRRTYVARATAVVPATRPSPDVETAVEKGEMSERPHHSHRPSSPIGPLNEKGLNFAPCPADRTQTAHTTHTRGQHSAPVWCVTRVAVMLMALAVCKCAHLRTRMCMYARVLARHRVVLSIHAHEGQHQDRGGERRRGRHTQLH